jgi:hypothetical protein
MENKISAWQVWYANEPTFDESVRPRTAAELVLKYSKVAEFPAQTVDDLDNIFFHMQGEIWSPKGEARFMIKNLGLNHTSMSVGDLVRSPEGQWMVVADVGFEDIEIEGL